MRSHVCVMVILVNKEVYYEEDVFKFSNYYGS